MMYKIPEFFGLPVKNLSDIELIEKIKKDPLGFAVGPIRTGQ